MNAYLAARNLKNEVVTIYAEYSNYPKVKRVPTGIKVAVASWDNASKQIKANAKKLTGATNTTEGNNHLKEVLSGLNDAVKSLYVANSNILPTVEQLNAHLATATEVIAAATAPVDTLVTQLLDFIEYQVKTADWADATRKGFVTLSNNIKAYEKASRTTWLLTTLTNKDIEDWQQWLLNTYDYNNATLAKRVRLLRQFLREKQPKNVNMSKVKALHSQMLTPPVVLYKSEIEALRQLDLSRSPRLERVRDLQQAQIFSGLRFSDLIALRQHHIKGTRDNRVIKMRMKKTGQVVTVPVFPQLTEVLEKYTDISTGEIELPALSNQKFNAYLKELCALVPQLQEPVIIEEKKRREIIVTRPLKYTLISSHSSRRSFCTLCLDLGFLPKQVMQWSGHKTLQAFSRYMGHSETQADITQQFAVAYSSK
jgi:integrase